MQQNDAKTEAVAEDNACVVITGAQTHVKDWQPYHRKQIRSFSPQVRSVVWWANAIGIWQKIKKSNLENDRNIPFWRDNRFSAEDKRQILSPSLLSIHHRHLLLSSRIEDPLLFTFNFFVEIPCFVCFSSKNYVAIYSFALLFLQNNWFSILWRAWPSPESS